MGEVYRARDTRLDRTVAVKVLPAHLHDRPELRARFEREARAVSALSHPHICVLHDVGRHEDTDYLVMEYLEGETLAARIARSPLPQDEALRYGVQIAQALAHAHQNGVFHRDLKPGNIILTKAGAKLLDFGLAKTSAVASDVTQLTATGTIVGTVQYMAPEQLEGKEAGAAADLFAFGAVLYEMLTGRKAFGGHTQASVIAGILERQPPELEALPGHLRRIVAACLTKEPGRPLAIGPRPRPGPRMDRASCRPVRHPTSHTPPASCLDRGRAARRGIGGAGRRSLPRGPPGAPGRAIRYHPARQDAVQRIPVGRSRRSPRRLPHRDARGPRLS
jgi:serine/threonine protein kinase